MCFKKDIKNAHTRQTEASLNRERYRVLLRFFKVYVAEIFVKRNMIDTSIYYIQDKRTYICTYMNESYALKTFEQLFTGKYS